MAISMGWKHYLVLTPEDTWGTLNDSNADLYIPYASNTIQTNTTYRQPDLTTGFAQDRYNEQDKSIIQGAISCPVIGTQVGGKSIAEHLIEAAVHGSGSQQESQDLKSFTGRWNDPAGSDNKRFLGLRANTLTIAGSSDAGVSMTVDWIGKDEVEESAMPALSHTQPQPAGARFANVTLFLSTESDADSASGTGESVGIRAFNLVWSNGLVAYHNNSQFPSYVVAGPRKCSFNFSILKDSDTYDLLRRSGALSNRAARLIIDAPHLGTGSGGTYSRIIAKFDRLNFNGLTEQVAKNALDQQDVAWFGLKPDTTNNALDFAFTLV